MAEKHDVDIISTADNEILNKQLHNNNDAAHAEASSTSHSESRTFNIQPNLNCCSHELYQESEESYERLQPHADPPYSNSHDPFECVNNGRKTDTFLVDDNKSQSILDVSQKLIPDDNALTDQNGQLKIESAIMDKLITTTTTTTTNKPTPMHSVNEDSWYEIYKSPNLVDEDLTKEDTAYEVYNKPTQMNAYKGLSNDFNNSKKRKSHQMSYMGMKLKEMTSLEEEHDCINEYEQVHEDDIKRREKGEPHDIHMKSRKSLPIGSFDIYEQLDSKATNFKLGNIVSSKSCILVIKIALSLIVLVVAMVIAVVITNFVRSRGLDLNYDKEQVTKENEPNDEHVNELDALLFLDKPRLLGVIPATGHYIKGLAVLNSELFVPQDWSTQVNVYDSNNLTLTRNLTIPGSSRPCAIVASPRYNCLYISDIGQNVIYRYNLSDNVISNWSVGEQCWGLSLTRTDNVLVTLFDTSKIEEYTPDGSLVRAISLDSSIECPRHSVQLSTDQFVVSHGDFDRHTLEHRVCIVNTSGHIIRCKGGFKGIVEQFDSPLTIVVDRLGNFIIADRYNDRIVLLSPSLTYLGQIMIPGYELDNVFGLHLDLQTRRLYVGEDVKRGRVFVLTV